VAHGDGPGHEAGEAGNDHKIISGIETPPDIPHQVVCDMIEAPCDHDHESDLDSVCPCVCLCVWVCVQQVYNRLPGCPELGPCCCPSFSVGSASCIEADEYSDQATSGRGMAHGDCPGHETFQTGRDPAFEALLDVPNQVASDKTEAPLIVQS
jgi:hypothetical protein